MGRKRVQKKQNPETTYRCFWCGRRLKLWEAIWSFSRDGAYAIPMCHSCAADKLKKRLEKGG